MKLFTEHPRSVGENYFQHFYFAFLFGVKMIAGGLACLIHAIFPFIFQKTGSSLLLKMTHCFVERAPMTEARILKLAELIEKKQKKILEK